MAQKKLVLKNAFLERVKLLLPNEKDYQKFLVIVKEKPLKSIRCNTLRISPEKLKKRLERKGWEIQQPWMLYPEVMIVQSKLLPGELGRSVEYQLGYYYVQELASMLPVIALNPQPDEKILDLCAAPGSKTTQIAAAMENTGTLFANEMNSSREKILELNTARCGVSNLIITKKEGSKLCQLMKKQKIKFSKILVDASCSEEGTFRSSPNAAKTWNPKRIKSLSKIQKRLLSNAIEVLEDNGEIVYSTCTHAPEENEEVVDFVLKKFPSLKIQEIKLPVKTRPGITEWKGKKYSESVEKSCRVYPQDNDTEGFFIAKMKKEN